MCLCSRSDGQGSVANQRKAHSFITSMIIIFLLDFYHKHNKNYKSILWVDTYTHNDQTNLFYSLEYTVF